MYLIYVLFICIAYLWAFNCKYTFKHKYIKTFFLVFLGFFCFLYLLRQQSMNVHFCILFVKKTTCFISESSAVCIMSSAMDVAFGLLQRTRPL